MFNSYGGGVMRFKVIVTTFIVCLPSVSLCQNFPFPQNRTYQYGIMPGGRNHQHAQSSYLTWKNTYVTSAGACGYRRVLFNDMSSTYSEGIGYGMLLAVNFDDKSLFDDLWAYHNRNLYRTGLMNWWIGSNCSVLGGSAATDADEDVAFALVLADRQWGSSGTINYLQRQSPRYSAFINMKWTRQRTSSVQVTTGASRAL